jgi:HEAT repeat protein
VNAAAEPDDALVAEQELPYSITLVEEMLRALMKAMRAHQLYLTNNPMHAKAMDACRAAFQPLWEATGEVSFVVTETELRWMGRPVLVEPAKASDSLPWLLHKDGVRELELLRGFEDDEVIRLLEIIQRVRRASPDEDDLITILWEQDFSFLRYKYVELSLDAVPGIQASAFKDRKVDVPAATVSAPADSPVSGIINMADFDTTLYFLDNNEVAYLQAEVAREYEGDLRTNVAGMLLDIFEAQAAPAVRDEIIQLLDYYLLHMLSTHAYGATAYLLRECAQTINRTPSLNPVHLDRLKRLRDRLSEADALNEMLQAMDDSATLPPQADVEELFAELRPAALEVLLAWIGRSATSEARTLVENAAGRLASANTSELLRLINSTDRGVRLEAMRRAGALRSTAAVTPLSKAISDEDADVRTAAALALGEIGSPGAMQALENAVEDASREVRLAAVRALATHTFRPALPKVENAIKGKQIRDADLTERMAYFEAYGALAGERGVPFLDGLLNGKGIFGMRPDAEMRACAALALGRVGTERALASLQKAANDKDVVVRSAINKAFRGASA